MFNEYSQSLDVYRRGESRGEREKNYNFLLSLFSHYAQWEKFSTFFCSSFYTFHGSNFEELAIINSIV
jgi:hypothetical protein